MVERLYKPGRYIVRIEETRIQVSPVSLVGPLVVTTFVVLAGQHGGEMTGETYANLASLRASPMAYSLMVTGGIEIGDTRFVTPADVEAAVRSREWERCTAQLTLEAKTTRTGIPYVAAIWRPLEANPQRH